MYNFGYTTNTLIADLYSLFNRRSQKKADKYKKLLTDVECETIELYIVLVQSIDSICICEYVMNVKQLEPS